MQRLAILCLLLWQQVAAVPLPRSVTVYREENSRSAAKSAAMSIPRGGFSLATTTAAAASAALGVNGGIMLLKPELALEKIYKVEPTKNPEEKRVSNVLVRNIGCASLGLATSIFLAMVKKMPVEKAVAWGLLPRSLCFVSNLSYKVRPFQIFSLILNFYGVVAMNIKTPTYMITWRFLGGRTLLEGLSLVKWPRGAVKSMFGYNDESDYQRILARSLGNEVASGAAYIGWMVLGLSAPVSLGLACLQYIVCAADTAWKDKVLTTKKNPHPTQTRQMIIAALVGIGSAISVLLK